MSVLNNAIKSDFTFRTILSMIIIVRSELNCAANLIEKEREREIKRRKERSKKGNENEKKTKKER
jgi:hypothetical protein